MKEKEVKCPECGSTYLYDHGDSWECENSECRYMWVKTEEK